MSNLDRFLPVEDSAAEKKETKPSPDPPASAHRMRAPVEGLAPSLVGFCHFFIRETGKCRFLASAGEDCLGHPCTNWRSFSTLLASRYGLARTPITVFDLREIRGKKLDKEGRAGR